MYVHAELVSLGYTEVVLKSLIFLNIRNMKFMIFLFASVVTKGRFRAGAEWVTYSSMGKLQVQIRSLGKVT